MSTPTILLVQHGRWAREHVAGWLAEAGYDVITCPGPIEPDYSCVAMRCGSCPLASAADVVVLDTHLAPDEAMIGTPSWQLLDFYVTHGRKVVAISDEPEITAAYPASSVQTLHGPLDRNRFLSTVDRFAGPEKQPKREETA